MPSSVAANGTPLRTHARSSVDRRNASKVGDPENAVPASSVVTQVNRNSTTLRSGREGAGRPIATVPWPLPWSSPSSTRRFRLSADDARRAGHRRMTQPITRSRSPPGQPRHRAPNTLESGLEVQGAHDRLQGGGQDGLALATAAQILRSEERRGGKA